VFAHSQGVSDSVITDHRVKQAGFGGYGRIVGNGAAVKGGRLLGTAVGQSFVDGAFAVAGQQGADAMLALVPPTTTAGLIEHLNISGSDPENKLDQRLGQRIFAAFGGAIDTTQPAGNIRDAFFFLATLPDFWGQVTPNDGVENLDSTTLGRHSHTFHQVDHILQIEDPAILHTELELLSQYVD
jgi:hypothetical protein